MIAKMLLVNQIAALEAEREDKGLDRGVRVGGAGSAGGCQICRLWWAYLE
jgi:hypothetical protein